MIGPVAKLLSAASKRLVASRFGAYMIGPGTDIFSWRVRGVRGGRLVVGKDCLVRSSIVFERENAKLSIGDRCFIGKGVISVAEDIEIGNDVLMSWGVTITDHNSHSLRFSERRCDVEDWHGGNKNWTGVKAGKVIIQDKVWIGFNAIVLKCVTIGEGAIVGAGSVVTKDVPPFTIVAGNPARVVRELGSDER